MRDEPASEGEQTADVDELGTVEAPADRVRRLEAERAADLAASLDGDEWARLRLLAWSLGLDQPPRRGTAPPSV